MPVIARSLLGGLKPFIIMAALASLAGCGGSEDEPAFQGGGAGAGGASGSGSGAESGSAGHDGGAGTSGGSTSIGGVGAGGSNASGGNASAGGGGGGSGGAQVTAAGSGGGGTGGSGGNASNAGGSGGSSTGAGGGAAGSGSSAMDPGTAGDGDSMIGPNFQDAAEYRSNPGKKGTIMRFSMSSTDSKIYPNDVANKNSFQRQVQVYLPNGYVKGTEVPFVVLQDGSQYGGDLTGALDSLIDSKKIPALVGVFVNPGPGDGPGSERGLEYDTVSEAYSKFVESELLPKVEASYGVKFTQDPEGRALMGGSSGGAAAFTAGWFRPDLYRRILCYSGSFVNLHSDAEYPHGAWGYHESLIAAAPNKPLRVFLEAGSNDNGAGSSEASRRNWVIANQKMAAALKAKNYHYRFVYAQGASHVDTRAIRQTLPDALVWLWRGYVPPK